MDNNNFKELNDNIKELTMAVRELVAVIKNSQYGKEKKQMKSEKDMCKAKDFVEQVYSGLYEISKIKEAMKKRHILDELGAINPLHPDCISWMIKDDVIYGDPDAINNLVIEMLAED